MKIWLQNKEAIAMMLRQNIDSGFATRHTRITLSKLHRSDDNLVDLDEQDIIIILDVYDQFAEDYYWAPSGSSRSHRSPTKRLAGPPHRPTGYASPKTVEMYLEDREEE